MIDAEIIILAEQLGLHWSYDDDPDFDGDESILLWHDRETESAGGVLFRFQNGQAYLADLRSLGEADANQNGHRRMMESDPTELQRCLSDYVERCRANPAAEQPPTEPAPAAKPKRRARTDQSRQRVHYCPPQSQRKEGQFKATDPLGHYYYVEIFREVSACKKMGPSQHFVTLDGENVERIAKGHYRLTQASVELFSDDPAAP